MNADKLELIKKVAGDVFDQTEPILASLLSRWLDEHKYEDINDYAAPIKPIVERNGGTFLKMNKRPFGFIYQTNGVNIQVRITTREYSWKVVKCGSGLIMPETMSFTTLEGMECKFIAGIVTDLGYFLGEEENGDVVRVDTIDYPGYEFRQFGEMKKIDSLFAYASVSHASKG